MSLKAVRPIPTRPEDPSNDEVMTSFARLDILHRGILTYCRMSSNFRPFTSFSKLSSATAKSEVEISVRSRWISYSVK